MAMKKENPQQKGIHRSIFALQMDTTRLRIRIFIISIFVLILGGYPLLEEYNMFPSILSFLPLTGTTPYHIMLVVLGVISVYLGFRK